MSKQRLLFITTGGTIASVRTQQGLKPVLSSEELLAHLPELKELCCPETLALCSIDSTDLGQEHWLMMARAIQENYALYDGFIICHGTDTLAYSAAALSYLIQNADKPIILTGAQQPISNEITDAKKNLRDSVVCAIDPGSRGVMVVFGGHVIAAPAPRRTRPSATTPLPRSTSRNWRWCRATGWCGTFPRRGPPGRWSSAARWTAGCSCSS